MLIYVLYIEYFSIVNNNRTCTNKYGIVPVGKPEKYSKLALDKLNILLIS